MMTEVALSTVRVFWWYVVPAGAHQTWTPWAFR
jgi:hypothetical protein